MALGVATTLTVVPNFIEGAKPRCSPCERGDLNALDRLVVGNHSPAAKSASDVFYFTAPALAAGLLLFDAHRFGWRAYGEDVLMVMEAALTAGAMQQLISLAVHRPRPYLYDATLLPTETTAEDARSFYSGHTAMVFAVALSTAYVLTRRRPNGRHRWLIWLAAIAAALPTPILRVAAGEHFVTDVLTGAVLGSAAGIFVPWLHERRLAGSEVAVAGNVLVLRRRF